MVELVLALLHLGAAMSAMLVVVLAIANPELTSKFTRAILSAGERFIKEKEMASINMSAEFDRPPVKQETARRYPYADTRFSESEQRAEGQRMLEARRNELREEASRQLNEAWQGAGWADRRGPRVEPARRSIADVMTIVPNESVLTRMFNSSDVLSLREVVTYNGLSPKEMESMRTLFEVFLVDRALAESKPLEAVREFLVVANTAEEARTIALLSLKVEVNSLNSYHVHAREICKVPLLPRNDRLLEAKD